MTGGRTGVRPEDERNHSSVANAGRNPPSFRKGVLRRPEHSGIDTDTSEAYRSDMAPKRIQRRRSKGWRMPEGAVYVARPGRYGNPWRVGDVHPFTLRVIETTDEAIAAYRGARQSWNHDYLMRWLAPLRGRDLACWCPLDKPCHADVLLELANA